MWGAVFEIFVMEMNRFVSKRAHPTFVCGAFGNMTQMGTFVVERDLTI